jgi:UDPglucose--hexose-1-phosphate uridylyltransferase
MSELRQDLISGDWVIVAPGRANRPHFLDAKKNVRKPSPLRDCPFEDLKVSGNWPPILTYPENALLGNNWKIAVINNKYPALMPSNMCSVPLDHGMYHGKTGVGTHQLIITRDHKKGFVDLDPAMAAKVFEIIQACHIMAGKDKCAEYVSSFLNWGPSSGASIWHPHYQVLTLPMVPVHTINSLKGAHRYYAKHHRCVRCDIIKNESKEKTRVIEENREAIAIAPYASKHPLEVSILPKKHITSFRDSSRSLVTGVALLTQSVMKRIRKYANDPDLNFFVHDAPLSQGNYRRRDYRYHHWHIEIIPKISTTAGFELSTWIDINTVDPDRAASILRGEQWSKK